MFTANLPSIALLLSYFTTSSLQLSIPVKALEGSTLLNFDDISTEKGSGSIPTPYNRLSFSKFSVIAPKDPYWDGKIADADKDLAVSDPNAIIGSKFGLSATLDGANDAPAIYLNSSVAKKDGIEPWFSLTYLKIKALGAPPPGTSIYILGFEYGSNDYTTFWAASYREMFNPPTLLDSKILGSDWAKLHRVEIWAEYGEEGNDHDFAIDDLGVKFFPTKTKEELHSAELKK
ncbi:MAG: hypothetical protein M1829_006934 [Trizodia sp. TS-e1964]|nr:MAG: hypothetical protein M1829_006934 [Trizodia sp. TS-e1964]